MAQVVEVEFLRADRRPGLVPSGLEARSTQPATSLADEHEPVSPRGREASQMVPGVETAFDRLVASTIDQIRKHEPGTLVYASHSSKRPDERIFYELYRDEDAFRRHEEQPHTRRFLAEREQLVGSFEVDFLALTDAAGLPDGDR